MLTGKQADIRRIAVFMSDRVDYANDCILTGRPKPEAVQVAGIEKLLYDVLGRYGFEAPKDKAP